MPQPPWPPPTAQPHQPTPVPPSPAAYPRNPWAPQPGWLQQPHSPVRDWTHPAPHDAQLASTLRSPYPASNPAPLRPPLAPSTNFPWHPPTPQPPKSGAIVTSIVVGTSVAVIGIILIIGITSMLMIPLFSGPVRPNDSDVTQPFPTIQPTMATGDPSDIDLNPPPLPELINTGDSQAWVINNPLYSESSVSAISCSRPTEDPTKLSSTQLEQHLNDRVACLVKLWRPEIERAGYQLPRPRVNVYSQPITTRCGKEGTRNAFYCSADQQIYFALDVLQLFPVEHRSSPLALEQVLAHEFGHAVQARTGILAAGAILETKATQTSAKNELSRRSELQADCFAGVYFHGVEKSMALQPQDVANIAKIFSAYGDDTLAHKPNIDGDHGLGTSRQRWGLLGLSSTKIGLCNTWKAAASEVR